MAAHLFKDIPIGTAFRGPLSEGAMWQAYEKITKSTARCTRQVGYGNTRAVGAVERFAPYASVYDIEPEFAAHTRSVPTSVCTTYAGVYDIEPEVAAATDPRPPATPSLGTRLARVATRPGAKKPLTEREKLFRQFCTKGGR